MCNMTRWYVWHKSFIQLILISLRPYAWRTSSIRLIHRVTRHAHTYKRVNHKQKKSLHSEMKDITASFHMYEGMCQAYHRVTSRICMINVTHIHEPCHTQECVQTTHILRTVVWMPHVAHMNASRRTHECVVWSLQRVHVIHINICAHMCICAHMLNICAHMYVPICAYVPIW